MKGDQSRTMSAPEALAIIADADLRAAAERPIAECRAAKTP